MRSPPTPSSLHWLIDRNARLQGEIAKLRAAEVLQQSRFAKRLIQLQQAIAKVQAQEAARIVSYQRQLKDMEAQLEATALMISKHEVPIDPSIIRPVKSHRKDRLVPAGMITRAIYQVLGSAEGRPRSAIQVAHFLVASLSEPKSTEDVSNVRYVVRQRMKNMTLEGKLIRCSDDPLSKEGRWTLPAEMFARFPHGTRRAGDAPANSP